jgi:hypothetical protein
MRYVILLGVLVGFCGSVCGVDSILNTVSNIDVANALKAQSSEGFKRKFKSAAAMQKKRRIAAAVLLPAALLVSLFGLESLATGRRNMPREVALLYFLGNGVPFAVMNALYFKQSRKKEAAYRKIAKHATKLYALLQDPEFKKKYEVDSWERVRKKRIAAEIAGVVPSLVLGGPALIVPFASQFMNYGLKPIISSSIRRSVGVPELEKVLLKHVKKLENAESAVKAQTAREAFLQQLAMKKAEAVPSHQP